jgi:hypothetical protein
MKKLFVILFFLSGYHCISIAQDIRVKETSQFYLENIWLANLKDVVSNYSGYNQFTFLKHYKNSSVLLFGNLEQTFSGTGYLPKLLNRIPIEKFSNLSLLINKPKAPMDIQYELLAYPAEADDTQKDSGISKNIYYFIGGAAVAAIVYLVWNKTEENSNSSLTFGKPQLP